MFLALGCVAKPPAPLRPHQITRSEAPIPAVGTWEGILESPRGPMPIRIVLDEARATLHLNGTVQSGTLQKHGAQLQVGVPSYGLQVAGTYYRDEWRATWVQAGRSLPLLLTRSVPD